VTDDPTPKLIRIKDKRTKESHYSIYNSDVTKNVAFFEITGKTSLLAVSRLISDSPSDSAVFSTHPMKLLCLHFRHFPQNKFTFSIVKRSGKIQNEIFPLRHFYVAETMLLRSNLEALA
jgi:hypothetical protein